MTGPFWRVYLLALGPFALLVGLVTSLAHLVQRDRPRAGDELVSSLLRSTAPMASGSALLLALVLWLWALPSGRLTLELDPGLKRAALLVLPGYALAALIALGAGGLAAALLGRSDVPVLGSAALLDGRHVGVGLLAALLDAALILILTRRYAGRLSALRASLPAKLILVVTVTVPLRATAALLLASALPA